MELAAPGPGASGNGVRTAAASSLAPGPGASLHAYDIGVLVVYFLFVVGVGIWVSSCGGWGPAGEAEPHSHLWLAVSWGRGGQRKGLEWTGLISPPVIGRQTEAGEGCDLPEVTQRVRGRPGLRPSPDCLTLSTCCLCSTLPWPPDPHSFPLRSAEIPNSPDA